MHAWDITSFYIERKNVKWYDKEQAGDVKAHAHLYNYIDGNVENRLYISVNNLKGMSIPWDNK